MTTKENIIEFIQKNTQKISSFGVKEIGLFGSYARGEQTQDSDIDILVDFNPQDEKFRNLLSLSDFISNSLNHKVDVISKKGLSKYIGPHILKEVHYVSLIS